MQTEKYGAIPHEEHEAETLPAVSVPDPMRTSAPAVTLASETAPPSEGLSPDKREFLLFVGTLEELLPVREVYKRLRVSADKGTRLKAQLIEAKLMIEVEVPLHAKGRNSKLLVLTSRGLDAVHLPMRAGKGGALHQHLQRVIATHAEQYGFAATVEAVGTNGKAVDIGVEQVGQHARRIGIPIHMPRQGRSPQPRDHGGSYGRQTFDTGAGGKPSEFEVNNLSPLAMGRLWAALY